MEQNTTKEEVGTFMLADTSTVQHYATVALATKEVTHGS